MKIAYFIFLGFVVILMLFSVTTYINFKQAERVNENSDFVSKSTTILRQGNRFQRNVLNMVSGLRGFLITGENYFVQAYDSAAAENEAILKELSLLIDDSLQRNNFTVIRQFNDQWVHQFAQPLIEAKRMEGSSDSSKLVFNRMYREKMLSGEERRIQSQLQSRFRLFTNYEYDLRDRQGKTLIASIEQTRNISFALSSDPNPGAKLEGPDSFLRYSLASLPEGEVSFIARRVKPGDSSFNGQTKVLTIQEGTSDFNSNPFRVRVEKRPPSEGGKMVFQFASQGNAGNAVETGGLTWVDLRPYYFKLEWRAGTARLRVFSGENETAPQLVDLSTTYTAPYAAGTPNVIIGSLLNDSLRDIRVSRLYIGPFPRPVALGSALTP